MQELLTTKELADFLRLNEKKVYELVREGGVPHVRIAGKWLFPKAHVERWIDEHVQREKSILIVGSDDMLMARLVARYSQDHLDRGLAFYASVGSLNGIKALAERKGQACCTHLLDRETGEYNLPFLERYLAPQGYTVVNLWYRSQGLILKKGNPLRIRGLEDVVTREARFINRNQGSGTRLLLEYLLRERGLDARGIVGFDAEANTHLEVALKVFFGEADMGLGIEYVTHLLPLDFVPLKEERFDLVVPQELWRTQVIQDFISHIDPQKIQMLSSMLPGYSLHDTGKLIFMS